MVIGGGGIGIRIGQAARAEEKNEKWRFTGKKLEKKVE